MRLFTEATGPSPARQPLGQPLVFAGLSEIWYDAEGVPLRSCSIITTAANKTMAPSIIGCPSFSLGMLGTSGYDLSR